MKITDFSHLRLNLREYIAEVNDDYDTIIVDCGGGKHGPPNGGFSEAHSKQCYDERSKTGKMAAQATKESHKCQYFLC